MVFKTGLWREFIDEFIEFDDMLELRTHRERVIESLNKQVDILWILVDIVRCE